MKIKLFSVMLVCLLTAGAFAQTEADFKVTVTKDGKGVVITEYTGRAAAVTIPATIQGMPVREIGGGLGVGAFMNNRTITSVVIPEGVTTIGIYAFFSCENLTSVTFPKTLTTMVDYAFTGTKLSTVNLSETSLSKIGDNAFGGCPSLTTVILPASIKEIGHEAFYWCSALSTVTIPATVRQISFRLRVFYNCPKIPLATQAALRQLGYKGDF
jgi:hypothetical protein